MSDIATKLSYLGETKSKIKESINLTGANLTNETFRQYATVLKDTLAHILKNPSPIWDNFPKTTATGSAIQVNTYNSLLDYSLDGNTTQNGTPTPTSPIPISNVSGLQEINICGKNLLYSSFYQFSANGIKCELLNFPSGTFTWSFTNQNIPGEIQVKIKVNGSYQTYANAYSTNKLTFTLNTPQDIQLESYRAGGNPLENYSKMMIEPGSTPTTYEPYKGNTYEINLGKNLLDTSSLTTATSNDITFTPVYNNGLLSYVNVNGTASNTAYYNIKQQDFGSSDMSSTTTNNNYTLSTGNNNANIKLGYTGSTTWNFIRVQSGATITNEKVYPMVVKGKKTTSYSPYFTPIELNKISTYKDYIFKGKGVNLFDKDSVVIGYVNADGTIQNDAAYNTSDFIPVMEQTSYYKTSTLSPRTKFYDENKTPLNTTTYQDVSIGGSAGTFTTPANACYFRFSFPIATVDKNTIQINEGSTALPYEPYNAKDKWLLHKEIGKVVLNGSETIEQQSTTSGNYRFAVSGPNDMKTNNELNVPAGLVISNKFIEISNAVSFIGDTNGILVRANNTKQFMINCMETITYTTAQFKTWLGNNNILVYYVLNTPTTTEITNSELLEDLDSIELLDGLNNIMINGDLSAIMNLTCLEKD